jgi:hypothetical protein
MQVLPCPTQRQHDWKTCPFKHQGEKVARRDLRVHPHYGIACWSFQEGEVGVTGGISIAACLLCGVADTLTHDAALLLLAYPWPAHALHLELVRPAVCCLPGSADLRRCTAAGVPLPPGR